MYFLKPALFSFFVLSLFMSSTNAQDAKHPNYEIAPTEYAELADKAIKHIEVFDWKGFYGMLSDDVEFYLPDGDAGTRTSFIGKKEVMEFWNSYEQKSGNSKLKSKDIVHLPVRVKSKLAYSKVKGIMVLSYFSLEMHYGAEVTNIRMNWGMHFNDDKKIAKIYTYYDRTPIIAAAKKNFLTQSKQNKSK